MYPVTTFGAPTPASSVSEGGITVVRHYPVKLWELLKFDFGYSFTLLPYRSRPERHFSRTKTFRVRSCHGLRKIWSFEIIWQSYEDFLNRISDSDCPFQHKAGSKFLRSKAFKVNP
ncbi:hypothetical protein TNCV_4930381 [Trichonephila clavipes]|nr:hypothetical protein TNCV_4930381 [Trichonephila clavipes]